MQASEDYAHYKEQPGIIDELMTDPTLRRTLDLTCPSCGHTEYVVLCKINETRAVMFQDQSKRTFNSAYFLRVSSFTRQK